MKQIRAILFDCDGTLVDTETIHAAGGNRVWEAHGIKQEEGSEFIGVHLTDILETMNARHGLEITLQAYLDVYESYMLEHIPAQIRILAETSAYVRSLHDRGYRMTVGSNGQRDIVMAELKAVNLLPYFETIITASDHNIRPKPYPDMYLEGMKAVGVDDPESCLVIEDSVTGIKAAIAAGMVPIGYTGLHHQPQELAVKLAEAGAFKVISRLQDLDFLLK